METKFDLEIWPNPKKIKSILTSIVVITVLAWICFLIGNIFWDEYTYPVTNLRGVKGTGGWPVTVYWGGLWIGIIGPLSFIIVRAMQDKKNPTLALSKNGLFINQQLIKLTTVEWSNVASIKKEYKDDSVELEFYFVDPNKIAEQQTGARKTFVKENLKDNKPLIVHDKLSMGDLDDFAIRAEAYMNK